MNRIRRKPLQPLALAFAGILIATSSPGTAKAATAASADDICAPSTDPCVISSAWDVTGVLDFGARTVNIVGSGRLHGGAIALRAGAINVSVGDGADTTIGGDGFSVNLLARRSCSGDLATLCLSHSQCTGLGTCSAGSPGTIVIDGTVSSVSPNGQGVGISAAGDITLFRRVSANASGVANPSGSVNIESFLGSVTINGPVSASAAAGSSYDYGVGEPGAIEIKAKVDVTLAGEARAWGPDTGGQVTIRADRDVIVHGDIVGASGSGLYAQGGYVDVTAGRDLRIVAVEDGDPVQEISTDGGGQFYFYGYGSEGGWASGYGGYQYLDAGGDIEVGSTAKLHSHGGPAATGGRIELRTYDGEVSVDGRVYAQGMPPAHGSDSGAGGGWIYVRAENGFRMGTAAKILTNSPLGQGGVQIVTNGPSEVDGLIDVHGTGSGQYIYANPGYIDIHGEADLTIGGKLRGGGNREGYDDWNIDVCRLHLEPTALLDQALDTANPSASGIRIFIGESMRADAKSRIETDPTSSSKTYIRYRDVDKPPILSGIISPAPVLTVDPTIKGCPVCGNLEIDEGESCDDGNAVSGDGCRNDCQDEGCLAATPGFPSIPICDDGVECTRDDCDPVAHACTHVVSCEDGIACTVDSCVAGACEHVPSDVLCEDGNDCTDDLCNDATGCVFASLTGNACEDGDFCTPPGTCAAGICDAGASQHTTGNSIKTKAYEGSGNDRAKLRVEVPLDTFTADPMVSGARLVLSDASGQVLYDSVLDAAQWELSGVLRWKYRGTGDVINTATIRGYESRGVVRISAKIGDGELGGAVGRDFLSLSVLFGSDVSSDPCMTARQVPCTSRGPATNCKN